MWNIINVEVDLSLDQWKFILEILEDVYLDFKPSDVFRNITIQCIKQQLPPV